MCIIISLMISFPVFILWSAYDSQLSPSAVYPLLLVQGFYDAYNAQCHINVHKLHLINHHYYILTYITLLSRNIGFGFKISQIYTLLLEYLAFCNL
jgi:hypothetical protein